MWSKLQKLTVSDSSRPESLEAYPSKQSEFRNIG